ncbi:MAG TPA: hypothetical protein VF281_01430 [Candidatus Saccharimonadales bacterium]
MNGPLKIESEPRPTDPLPVVKTKLMERYGNDRSRAESIKRIVHHTAKHHSAELDNSAEFWLLLSVGSLIGQPLQIYGSEASIYRDQARSCDDMTDELDLEYAEILCEQLEKRLNRRTPHLGDEDRRKYDVALKKANGLRERLTDPASSRKL